MTTNLPRRPGAGSRTPISRPRRIAGSDPVAPAAEGPAAEEPSTEKPVVEEPVVEELPTAAPVEERAESGAVGPGSRRARGLALVIVALLALGTWELVSIVRHEGPLEAGAGPVTAERPVQVDELTARSVVDQAAQAAVAIGSASWEDYEAGVDAAAAMMTDPFADTYRETKADVKEQVVDQRLDVTVQVDAQGVVRADPNEVVALVFLTQSTIAGTGPVTPRQYRATVTMVRTDDGWLVADLDAGDLLDIAANDG